MSCKLNLPVFRPFRQGGQGLLEPSLAAYFVDVFDEHADSFLVLCFYEKKNKPG